MTRELLLTILKAAPGMEGKTDKFDTKEGHRVSFHLGAEGRGVVANDVLAVELADTFVCLTTEDQGEIYVPYDGVHSLAVKPLKEHAPKKTGFA